MKNKGIYINVFLGILMLVANLLPALHAHEHFYSSDFGNEQLTAEVSEKLSKPAINCDLCDFNFSSTDEPVISSYKLYLPQNFSILDISIPETTYLFPQTIFSLRAPPVVIA